MRGSRPVITSSNWVALAACVSVSAGAAVPCPLSPWLLPLSAESSVQGKGVELFREADELRKTDCLAAAQRFVESAKYLFVPKADVAKFVLDPTEPLKADRLYVYQRAWACFVDAGQATLGREQLKAAAKADPALAKDLATLTRPKARPR